MNTHPHRGDVYWVKLDPTVGSEINKTRPAVVVSNDIGNEASKRVIIAPITSSIKQVHSFEVKITIGDKEGKVLAHQVRSIDKQRLLKKVAQFDDKIMNMVDKALKIALALT